MSAVPSAVSEVRGRARSALGVTGQPLPGRLEESVAAGSGWLPIIAIGLQSGLVLAQGIALLLAPSIALSLGTSTSVVGELLGLWSLGLVLAVPFGLRGALRGWNRPAVAWAGGTLVALAEVSVAVSRSHAELAVAGIAAGFGSGLATSVHSALLADSYPGAARAHIFSARRAVGIASGVVLLIAGGPASAGVGLSWRGGLLVVAAGSAAIAAGMLFTNDVGVGDIDSEAIRRILGTQDSGRGVQAVTPMSFSEAVRRALRVPSVRPIMGTAAVVVGLGYVLVVFGGYLLTQRQGMPYGSVGWVLAGIGILASLALLDFAGLGSADFRMSPRRLGEDAVWMLYAAALGLVVIAVLPFSAVVIAAMATVGVALALAIAAIDRLLSAVLPAELRGVGSILLGGYFAVFGVLCGGSLAAGIDGSIGTAKMFACAAAVALAGALVLRGVAPGLSRDLDRAVDRVVEREQASSTTRSTTLLSASGIDFSYGPVQILFGVDLRVDDGEMVALLGSNGAGKSTLLRVLSGLGLPDAGTVRYRGKDITFAEPAERVRAGISSIHGGKAVFGPMSVADNLLLYGYSLGRDKAAVRDGIETGFAAFPRLHERRNSLASTLSGGEQQMLALTKALILAPKLLLIDELSLGLAPKVVGELLAMVRTINASGTAVVLVEQSVNVALTLAQRAYFMEKGEVRFEGPTADLLDRPDVLRSVFLAGATKAGISS